MSLGSRFLTSVIQTGDVTEYLKYGQMGALFDADPLSKPLFQFVDDYVRTYSQLPPTTWIKEKLSVELGSEEVAAGALHKDLFDRYMTRAMKLTAEKANELIKDDPKKAFETMTLGLQAISATEMMPQVSDFRRVAAEYWPIFVQHWSDGVQTVPWQWQTLQKQSKGLRAGDLVSIVGRPGLGKTWLMLSAALHTWVTTDRPVIFVSMEMMRENIMERLAALYTKTAMDFFKDGYAPNLFGQGGKQAVKKALMQAENAKAPFYVVDGNLTATVEDVYSLCQQYGPSALYIDGAYMLGHPKETEMFKKVSVNVNLLKQTVATRLKVPTICSWQFAREADKLKPGQVPTLAHIGYSDVIGQASSIVMGLFQNDDDSNAEMIKRRRVNILKGRSGEIGEFNVSWDFVRMVFDEYTVDVENGGDLQSEVIY